MKHEEHTKIQKVWWWIVTVYHFVFNKDIAEARLEAREECINNCKLK